MNELTRSDILQGQALFKRVKQLLTKDNLTKIQFRTDKCSHKKKKDIQEKRQMDKK